MNCLVSGEIHDWMITDGGFPVKPFSPKKRYFIMLRYKDLRDCAKISLDDSPKIPYF